MKSALALTFHSLGHPSHVTGTPDLAAERYVISDRLFLDIVSTISSTTTSTVSGFANESKGDWIILTFDDGLISDYEIAFPILRANGLRATFFVTSENVGRVGYVTFDHLLQMTEAGMEIGSHGLTHRYLIEMPHADAMKEIRESKVRLERELGFEIVSFAPVGGHFHKWMLKEAHEADYRTFATMIPGRTYTNKGMVILHRNHIQAHHDAGYVSRLLSRQCLTLVLNSLPYHLLRIPKVVLGMQNYDRIKEFFFKHKYRKVVQDQQD